MPSATLSGIGRQLRDARHARDLSIEEAAWRTRIRPEFLRALEQERFSAIGHHAFVRSHLHSYARVLGLDPDEMVSMYRDAYGPEDPSPIETLNRQVRVTRLKRPKLNWVRAAAIAGAILVAAGVVGVLHGPGDRGRSAPGLAALPRLSGPSEASRDRVAKAPPAAGVRIEIAALGRCWVRITVDGARAFEGVLTAGDRRSFDGATVEVVLGNAAAARILVNGDPFDPGVAGVWRGTFGPEAPKT